MNRKFAERERRSNKDSDLARPLDEQNQERRAKDLARGRIGFRERCMLAAAFRTGQPVCVDNIPGVGKVTSVDSKKRGIVFVKHPHMREEKSYNADFVHAIEKEE